MIVNFLGENSFRLQSGETSLVVNPANNRFKADVVLRTIIPSNAIPPTDEIAFPGEYEVKGIEVYGYGIDAESTEKFLKTAYLVQWEDMRFVFLGHLSKSLPAEFVETLGEPDVLFIPSGEHYISALDAARLIKQLEPKIVIPSFSKKPDELLGALGQKSESQEKFVFKYKDITGEKGRVIVLEPKG